MNARTKQFRVAKETVYLNLCFYLFLNRCETIAFYAKQNYTGKLFGVHRRCFDFGTECFARK